MYSLDIRVSYSIFIETFISHNAALERLLNWFELPHILPHTLHHRFHHHYLIITEK